MPLLPDLFVCNPDLMINAERSGTFLRFEVWDGVKGEPSGKSHTLAMATEDAMILMKLLQTIRDKYSLPEADFDPVHVSVPKNKN